MKRVYLEKNWKESWKNSYTYDLLEIYGEIKKNLGYSYAYQIRRDQTFSLIKSVTKEGDKILDVAAAQGNFTLMLAQMGFKVTWNDIRADLAEYVEMKREAGNIVYKSGDAFNVKFDGLFDLVLATEIIEHVAHPDEFLSNLSRLVKSKGYIVISTPLGTYFNNKLPKFSEIKDASVYEHKQFGPNAGDHIFLLHMDEIPLLAKKAGLEVVEIKYYTNILTFGHLKMDSILKLLPKKLIFDIERYTQKLPEVIGKRIHNNFSVLFRKVK